MHEPVAHHRAIKGQPRENARLQGAQNDVRRGRSLCRRYRRGERSCLRLLATIPYIGVALRHSQRGVHDCRLPVWATVPRSGPQAAFYEITHREVCPRCGSFPTRFCCYNFAATARRAVPAAPELTAVVRCGAPVNRHRLLRSVRAPHEAENRVSGRAVLRRRRGLFTKKFLRRGLPCENSPRSRP